MPRLQARTYFILALALSALAAALTFDYLSRLGARVPVVVARVDLIRPQRLTAELLQVVDLPAAAVHPQAFSDPGQVVGRVLLRPVAQGTPVLQWHLAPPAAGPVDAQLGPGEAALFIPAGPERALGGAVAVGDRVQLVHVQAGRPGWDAGATVLAIARVLDVRDADGRSLEDGGYPAGVLVALDAVVVPDVALALETGRVYLALPGPSAGAGDRP